MGLAIEEARREFIDELHRLAPGGGDPKLQAYHGSPYPVLGLSSPQARAIVRAFVRAHRRLTVDEVNTLASALWQGPTLEEKSFAISLMGRYWRVIDDRSWAIAGAWVDEAVGWALSDSLASGPIATMVFHEPSRFRELLEWTRSDFLWRRRAATYALRDFVRAGALDKPFALLRRLLYDREFWVQRAVGTWLRECWKKDRRRTEAFLRKYVRGLPPVVITVATERAPKSFREALRRARAATTVPTKRAERRRSRKH